MAYGREHGTQQGGVRTRSCGGEQTCAGMCGGGDEPARIAASPTSRLSRPGFGEMDSVCADALCECTIAGNEQAQASAPAKFCKFHGEFRATGIAVVAQNHTRPAARQCGGSRQRVWQPHLVGEQQDGGKFPPRPVPRIEVLGALC